MANECADSQWEIKSVLQRFFLFYELLRVTTVWFMYCYTLASEMLPGLAVTSMALGSTSLVA